MGWLRFTALLPLGMSLTGLVPVSLKNLGLSLLIVSLLTPRFDDVKMGEFDLRRVIQLPYLAGAFIEGVTASSELSS